MVKEGIDLGMDPFEGLFLLMGDAGAVLIFDFPVGRTIGTLSGFDSDRTEGGFEGLDFALKGGTFPEFAANAKRTAMFKEAGFDRLDLFGGDKGVDDGTEAALFEGGGALPTIHCARLEDRLAEECDGLCGHVIDVGGEFRDRFG